MNSIYINHFVDHIIMVFEGLLNLKIAPLVILEYQLLFVIFVDFKSKN